MKVLLYSQPPKVWLISTIGSNKLIVFNIFAASFIKMGVIGKMNKLTVLRETAAGFFLGAPEQSEVLLPLSQSTPEVKSGAELEVFVYTDGDGKQIASLNKPYAAIDSYAYLRVTSVTDIGSFMDWGLEKDLFIPFGEQREEMEESAFYVVYVYLDKLSNRIVGSSKLDKFIITDHIALETGQAVDLLIYEESPLGYSCIINNMYKGLIYHNDIYNDVYIGDELQGYVRNIREDKLIDVSFQKSGFKNVLDSTEVVMAYLKKHEGFIALHDKSAPEEISIKLSMSKATFKKAIGILYRHRKVLIKPDGVYLVPEET
jgi:predicted RNA-binding protein (virulence factor B family)